VPALRAEHRSARSLGLTVAELMTFEVLARSSRGKARVTQTVAQFVAMSPAASGNPLSRSRVLRPDM